MLSFHLSKVGSDVTVENAFLSRILGARETATWRFGFGVSLGYGAFVTANVGLCFLSGFLAWVWSFGESPYHV